MDYRKPALAFAASLLWPCWAAAQQTYCLTQQYQCAVTGHHLPGSPCHCPQNRTAAGVTVILDEGGLYRASPQPQQRYGLRNDDIDADDDLLAGPRNHHRRNDAAREERD